MSNLNPAHRPAGTPDGGQFARTARAEAADVQELDGAPGSEAPVDPLELIAAHERQRGADNDKIDDLWNTACGTGEFDEYESAKDGFNQMEFQRYRALANAVRNAPAPVPPVVAQMIGPAEAIRDRKALDLIARGLGEQEEWAGSEDLEWIAETVAKSGRPHPGASALSDKELAAIERAGDDPDEAYAKAYRDKLTGSHAAAANANLDATALGTAGLDDDLNATYLLMRDAENRVQALTTRSLARQLLTAVPDAAYLDVARDEENRSHMSAVSIVGKDGISKDAHEWAWETADAPDIMFLTSQLEFDNDQWSRFTVETPPNEQHEKTYRIDLWAATKAGDS